MPPWVHAAERAYVASATHQPVARGGAAEDLPRARAAIGAIASHYLAVGTPRSFGLISTAATIEDAIASHAAHLAWFAPRDVRCAGDGAIDVAAATNGHVTSLEEALACDIVCLHAPLHLTRAQLRRGTHVNVLTTATYDAEVTALATIVHEDPGLGELAAGLVDGRQLDELTVFVIGDAAIALSAVAAATRSPASPG